jgi:hypothetical protein
MRQILLKIKNIFFSGISRINRGGGVFCSAYIVILAAPKPGVVVTESPPIFYNVKANVF